MKFVSQKKFAAFLFCAVAAVSPSAAGVVLREAAVLYDSHSAQSTPLLILTAGYPLREISRVDGWRKISLHTGESGWVRERQVRPLRAGVVVAELAAVRVSPENNAPESFYARRGVVLEVLQNTGAWLEVLHPDGETGYIRIADIWANF